jgi:FixJ family two-component response regulator
LHDSRRPYAGIERLGTASPAASDEIAHSVIFITAYWNDETRQTALRGGAVAFFHKPFQREALLDAIRSALDSAQAAES